MVFQQHLHTLGKIIEDAILLEFLFSQPRQRLHKPKPDESSLRDKRVSLPVCARHRVSCDEGQVGDLQGSILVDDFGLLAELGEGLIGYCPDIAEGIPG